MKEFPSIFQMLVDEKGWHKLPSEDRGGHGYVASIDKDGLRFTQSADPSGIWYSVANARGWADAADLVRQFGGEPTSSGQDFEWLSERCSEVNEWIGSGEHKKLVKEYRATRMEKLRDFQRSIGMEESWLAGEEDDRRIRSSWAREIRSLAGLKYWIAGLVALLYICYKVFFAEDRVSTTTALGGAFAAVLAYWILMRIRKSSAAHTGIEK